MRFKDKVVLVLGGNSGIGLTAAKAFAVEGAIVHFTGRSWRTIEEAQEAIPGSTGYQSDIADPAATEDLIARVEGADGRIDVLYINAGVGGFAPLREITEQAWDPGMSDEDVARLKEMMIRNIPMHRMGESEEVAKAVLFLASDDAAFITGANLFVDGGLIELR